MTEIHSFYNNEILTGIAILSVLHEVEELEVSKALLVQPILSYRGVLNFVKKKNVKIRSIEELISKKSLQFCNFNKRYFDNLELSMNAILLMRQLGFLDIRDNKLVRGNVEFDLDNKTLGDRANEIIKGASNISNAINKGDASNLYLSLRIEL
ncbi:three component ABC system middle component [Oscillibacter sp.]|uniref:three component ABC system middle component n=1 Tax=Oscillibacter sp. TaxID=1945593 RepID=UPI0028A88065|nr:three component ABC system middle component [Oscillibacter sp.]